METKELKQSVDKGCTTVKRQRHQIKQVKNEKKRKEELWRHSYNNTGNLIFKG